MSISRNLAPFFRCTGYAGAQSKLLCLFKSKTARFRRSARSCIFDMRHRPAANLTYNFFYSVFTQVFSAARTNFQIDGNSSAVYFGANLAYVHSRPVQRTSQSILQLRFKLQLSLNLVRKAAYNARNPHELLADYSSALFNTFLQPAVCKIVREKPARRRQNALRIQAFFRKPLRHVLLHKIGIFLISIKKLVHLR